MIVRCMPLSHKGREEMYAVAAMMVTVVTCHSRMSLGGIREIRCSEGSSLPLPQEPEGEHFRITII